MGPARPPGSTRRLKNTRGPRTWRSKTLLTVQQSERNGLSTAARSTHAAAPRHCRSGFLFRCLSDHGFCRDKEASPPMQRPGVRRGQPSPFDHAGLEQVFIIFRRSIEGEGLRLVVAQPRSSPRRPVGASSAFRTMLMPAGISGFSSLSFATACLARSSTTPPPSSTAAWVAWRAVWAAIHFRGSRTRIAISDVARSR